jgi:hypothetical protein
MQLDDKIYKPGSIQNRISNAKNHLVLPDAYASNSEIARADMAAKVPATRDIYRRYWERCRQSDAMDFDDLLVYTYVLFRDHPEIRHKYAAQFRPLFFWSDADKAEYESFCGVVHSDCYTVYGMKRTGCAGCPFNSRWEEELEVIKKYEPKLYKAAINIFGESYEYTRKYRRFKESWKREKRRGGQIDLFDRWDEM